MHFAHHLARLLELLEEAVHLHDAGARTFGDALFARAVEQRGVSALGRGHRRDYRLYRFEGIVAYLHAFQRLIHARNHTHQVFHRAHLLDLLQLREEVVEVELILRYLLADAACFLFVVLLLRALHEAHHVAHA